MNVSDALKTRRSIRGYKPDPVAPELLEKIFDQARLAPSNCNTQPWHTVVVSGQARKNLQAAIFEEIMSGKTPSPVFTPGDSGLSGVYKERQYQCAFTYYGVMGIERHEKEKRQQLALKNWEFFDAPHVAFISMPASMGPINAIDIGLYLQTLMLLLVENGLASCPQGALAFYPDPVFKIANIPEGNAIVCGISFGYEDVGARINDVIMDRDPLTDLVQFID